MRRSTLVAGLVLLLVSTAPAGAKAPDATGWWWQGQQGALSDVGAMPAPPSVPEDGLYVASGPLGEQAMAAVRLALGPGERSQLLVLKVAEVTGTPVLGACATVGPWEPRHNAPYEDRPEVDAERCAPGTVADDGLTVSFEIGSIATASAVDVAIVAGVNEDGSPATFQASFEPPGDDAIPVTAAPAAAPAPRPAASPAATPSATTPAAFRPAPPQPPAAVPVLPDPLATSAGRSSVSFGGPTEQVATRRPARDALTAVGLLGCTLVVGAWFVLDRRQERPPRMLTSFQPAGSDLTLSLGDETR